MREGLLNIMVVGTADGIVMIESGAKEVKEETVVDAIEFGHTEIKKICAAHQRSARQGRQAEAQGRAAGIRRGVLQRSEESKIGAELTDALDTEKHPKAESYDAGQGHQEETAGRAARRRRRGARRSSSSITRRCASAFSASR